MQLAIPLSCTRLPPRGFANITSHIGRASIHFRGVFSAERSATVGAETAVCVNDNLSSRNTAVARWSADDESSRRVDVNLGIVVDILARNCNVDNFVDDFLFEFFHTHVFGVLATYDYSIHSFGNIVDVFDRDL